MDNIEYKTGLDNMDMTRVTAMLSKAYWSPGIGLAEVTKAAQNSALVVGAFNGKGCQIGYGRVISDKTRFAYLTDFYVEEGYRGRGVAQQMIDRVLKAPELSDVYQWLLLTKDAHSLYRKNGFTAAGRPQDFMEIRKPRPQR